MARIIIVLALIGSVAAVPTFQAAADAAAANAAAAAELIAAQVAAAEQAAADAIAAATPVPTPLEINGIGVTRQIGFQGFEEAGLLLVDNPHVCADIGYVDLTLQQCQWRSLTGITFDFISPRGHPPAPYYTREPYGCINYVRNGNRLVWNGNPYAPSEPFDGYPNRRMLSVAGAGVFSSPDARRDMPPQVRAAAD